MAVVLPFFGKLVSSMIQASIGSLAVIEGKRELQDLREDPSDQGDIRRAAP